MRSSKLKSSDFFIEFEQVLPIYSFIIHVTKLNFFIQVKVFSPFIKDMIGQMYAGQSMAQLKALYNRLLSGLLNKNLSIAI